MTTLAAGATVSDIMIRKVVNVAPTTSVAQAAKLLATHGIRHLVVVDDSGVTLGVFSERDLMKDTVHRLSRDEVPGCTTIEELELTESITVSPDLSIRKAAEILAAKKFGCLPVTDADRHLVGIVTPVDLLRYFSDADEAGRECDQTSEEMVRLVSDFEMAKDVYESYAVRFAEMVYELHLSKQNAEEALRAKSEFLANMSHELRTPLTAILGFSELLAEATLDPEESEDAIQSIKNNGKHLLQIINDILDLSKLDAGGMKVDCVRCSPFEIVGEVRNLMQVLADRKQIEFHIDFATRLPQFVQTDPVRVRQILINLVGNAIKFTDQGVVRLVARFEPDAETPTLELEVTDSGIGMSEEQMAGVFEPFAQADTSITRRFGGTGLGLAICNRLCKLLGGEISVTSELGQGTTFRVLIPVGLPEDVTLVDFAEEHSRAENQVTLQACPSHLDCRVLLAEDGPCNQRLIAYFLTKAGCEVTVAENGEQALEMINHADVEGSPFDLILMDMQMPVLNGYAATRRLREQGCRTPVVALTAHAMRGDREKCLAAGCDEYLTKPIDRANLIDTVLQLSRTDSTSKSVAVIRQECGA